MHNIIVGSYAYKSNGEIELKDKLNSEINYFISKLSEVSYNPNRFKLMFGEDKFLFGAISANVRVFRNGTKTIF